MIVEKHSEAFRRAKVAQKELLKRKKIKKLDVEVLPQPINCLVSCHSKKKTRR